MAQSKKTRQHKRPNKKWDKEEVLKMLKYIQKERNLEKPTAQIYYRKLLETTKIDTTWDLMKWKMRYLRETFKKAQEWKNKIDAGIIDEDDELIYVEAKLNQMCPHYNILSDIFGEKYKSGFEFYDTSSDILTENAAKVKSPRIHEEMIEMGMVTANSDESSNAEQCLIQVNEAASTSVSLNNKTDKLTKLKCKASKTAIDKINLINIERNELLKLKIEAEKEYNEKKFNLETMKFKEEKERRKEEFQLRKQELELKKMELERDERLKMYEIRMKYGQKD